MSKCYGNVIGFDDIGYMEMCCRIIYNSHKANQPIRYFMWFEQGHCMVKAGVSVFVLRKKRDLFRYVALFRNVRQNSQ